MNNQQKNETLLKMSSEDLMEKCLEKIFNDICQAESQGQLELRNAAIRAAAIAEGTLTEVRLRRAGLSMFDQKDGDRS